MLIVNTLKQLNDALASARQRHHRIGLVPTMGALHAGHTSLVAKAHSACDVVVVSIFVNPTQFNNLDDLHNYPKTLTADLNLLFQTNCTIVYTPDTAQLYNAQTPPPPDVTLGIIGEVMEAQHRPGHFKGVLQVVDLLLTQVAPTELYLGQKDFQQCAVISQLIQQHHPHLQLITLPTIRETDGLAMSSRNSRLDPHSRALAPNIHQTLQHIKKAWHTKPDATHWQHWGQAQINTFGDCEYVKLVDALTLLPANSTTQSIVICVAALIGGVRLIDNIKIENTHQKST